MSLARLPFANLTLRLILCLISLGICLHFAADFLAWQFSQCTAESHCLAPDNCRPMQHLSYQHRLRLTVPNLPVIYLRPVFTDLHPVHQQWLRHQA